MEKVNELEESRTWRLWEKTAAVAKTATATATPLMSGSKLVFIVVTLFLGALAFSQFNTNNNNNVASVLNFYNWKNVSEDDEITYSPSLNCTAKEAACPANYVSTRRVNRATTTTTRGVPSNLTCPEYFRWIYEDLRHWKKTGITKAMVEKSRERANFRVTIVRGRLYVETYSKAFQSRDVFTIWGFIQLLRWYPGKIPDLDLMFNCDDTPVVRSGQYDKAVGPPPLFKYCSDKSSIDIVFPDWSFWGWPEVNIKPWKSLVKEMREGNMKMKWEDRLPVSYWKGNSYVAQTRRDLFNCNASAANNSEVFLYQQDWVKESHRGFRESNLADQCIHRYKIYIEGRAWSVSEKYIMACDSPTLYVDSSYYEFFSRGMFPLEHYWPINARDKCKSLKFAVQWGNDHPWEAKEIGMKGSSFVMEKVKMEYVYDYMYHLLKQYAKLLKFKPEIPINATEMCPESMACNEGGVRKEFLMESWEAGSSGRQPCSMSRPFKPKEIKNLDEKRGRFIQRVESWKNDYWKKKKN